MSRRRDEISAAFEIFLNSQFPQDDGPIMECVSQPSCSSERIPEPRARPDRNVCEAEVEPTQTVVVEENIDLEDEGGTEEGSQDRKQRFTAEEKHLIVLEVRAKYDLLFGRLSDKLPKANKTRIWKDICNKVNALGVEPRTVAQVIRKWYDCKRQVKEKLKKIEIHSKQTGGGPPTSLKLNETEEIVADTFRQEQISGIGNFDVLAGIEDSNSSEPEQVPTAENTSPADPSSNHPSQAVAPSNGTGADPIHTLSNQLINYMGQNESFFSEIIAKQTELGQVIANSSANICSELAKQTSVFSDVKNILQQLLLPTPEQPYATCHTGTNEANSYDNLQMVVNSPIVATSKIASSVTSVKSFGSSVDAPIDLTLNAFDVESHNNFSSPEIIQITGVRPNEEAVYENPAVVSPDNPSTSAQFLLAVKTELSTQSTTVEDGNEDVTVCNPPNPKTKKGRKRKTQGSGDLLTPTQSGLKKSKSKKN